jgi:hypothetical protein
MAEFTDERMRALLAETSAYTAVILRRGPEFSREDSAAIRWEHGRRNFELRESGDLAVVFPVADGSDVTGIGIFSADVERVRALMEHDPAVRNGVFVFEMHPTRSFPGDRLS